LTRKDFHKTYKTCPEFFVFGVSVSGADGVDAAEGGSAENSILIRAMNQAAETENSVLL
jgi:hypothetical protein